MLLLFILLILVILFSINKKSNSHINILARQSARYAYAAQQDKAPLVALLHANYAAGYLWALKDISTEAEINLILGPNMLKNIESHITNIQDKATRTATKACPKLVHPYSNVNILRLAGNI